MEGEEKGYARLEMIARRGEILILKRRRTVVSFARQQHGKDHVSGPQHTHTTAHCSDRQKWLVRRFGVEDHQRALHETLAEELGFSNHCVLSCFFVKTDIDCLSLMICIKSNPENHCLIGERRCAADRSNPPSRQPTWYVYTMAGSHSQDAVRKTRNRKDGRLHTQFIQHATRRIINN